MKSSLYINAGLTRYQMDAFNWEIYSANYLINHSHGRMNFLASSAGSTFKHSGVHISDQQTEFIDERDVLHVIRYDSDIAQLHLKKKQIDVLGLAQALMLYGEGDEKRKGGKGRVVEIGINTTYKADGVISGKGFIDQIPSLEEKKKVLLTLCSLSQLIWDCMQEMNFKAKQPPLCDDPERDKFAQQLRQYLLHMFGDDEKTTLPFQFVAPFEWNTLSICLLFPIPDDCCDHRDLKNCKLRSYARTGCANFILEDKEGRVFLLQFLCNFRRSIEIETAPCTTDVDACVDQIRSYQHHLQVNYKKLIYDVYDGPSENRLQMTFIKDGFNTDGFFLDDHLTWEPKILNTKPSFVVSLDLFLVPIPFSRPLSLSAFICAMYNQRGIFTWDQALELCFMGSFVNSPLHFYHIVSTMTQEDAEANNGHVFLTYLQRAKVIFNTFQGGSHPRYGPCGMKDDDMEKLFGADDGETITKVLHVLCEHVQWIDSKQGKQTAEELPYDEVEQHYRTFTNKVATVVASGIHFNKANKNVEFSNFRAQIFTTLITTLHLTLPGRHLMQLMIPMDGQASYAQLKEATKFQDRTGQHVPLPSSFFEKVMKLISIQLMVLIYCRNFIESGLCEGKNGRTTDQERSAVFIKGISLHDIFVDGSIKFKAYGKYEWDVLPQYRRFMLMMKEAFYFDFNNELKKKDTNQEQQQ